MNNIEEWRDIKGYEGYYQVSNYGRVKSVERTIKSRWGCGARIKERILKQVISNRYLVVCLRRACSGKMMRVHRLVASAFISDIPIDMDINHIDANKNNNNIRNLEIVTRKENVEHALKLGLSPSQKHGAKNPRSIKVLGYMLLSGYIIGEYESMHEAEKETGISNWNISLTCSGSKQHTNGIVWRKIS